MSEKMPPAISGSGGDKITFAVVLALRYGFDLKEDEAWPILLKYNERCEPPWTEKELRHKLTCAASVTCQSQPCGYLRSEGTPSAKPAKPAKPIRLRRATSQQRMVEAKLNILFPIIYDGHRYRVGDPELLAKFITEGCERKNLPGG